MCSFEGRICVRKMRNFSHTKLFFNANFIPLPENEEFDSRLPLQTIAIYYIFYIL